MKLIYTILFTLACTLCLAQQERDKSDKDRQEERERLKAARVAFLSNRLQLDVNTAQKFWPIFNEYESKKEALSEKYNKQKHALVSENGWRNMSDANADKMLDIYLEHKQAELNLEKDYMSKFNQVLDKGQIWMVIRIDSDFRRSLMKRISDRDAPPKDSNNDGNKERPKDRN